MGKVGMGKEDASGERTGDSSPALGWMMGELNLHVEGDESEQVQAEPADLHGEVSQRLRAGLKFVQCDTSTSRAILTCLLTSPPKKGDFYWLY